MPHRSPTRFIPLIVLLALLIGLSWYFGPRLWQGYLFRQSCSEMLARVEAGNLQGVTPYILPSQRSRADNFFHLLPAGYQDHLDDLDIYQSRWLDNDTMEAVVSFKVGNDETKAPYQCLMFWHWQAGQWLWDFDETMYASWPGGGEPNWEELETAIARAIEAYN